MGGGRRRTPETAMLHPVDPHPPVDIHDRETASWPLAITLAVIGPLALAVAVAVLAAIVG
jgi:hypothetical protein